MSSRLSVSVATVARRAVDLMDYLVDHGPTTSADLCEALGVTRGALALALSHARTELCPSLGLVIPHPLPENGWRYMVTDNWQDVEAGSSFALARSEVRLASIHRDVKTILPKLDPRSVPGRRARFLDKHLAHILGTLEEINDGEG